MTKSAVRLADLFRYYRGEPHQVAAVEQLGELIPADLLSREQDWFKTWSTAGREPAWLAPALKIIREFEGLRLEAYQDSVGVWTIGYGTTRYPNQGGPVRKGDVITRERADDLLRDQVQTLFAPGILSLLPMAAGWPANQTAALISWAYNVGLGAVEDSTLRKRLLAGEDPSKVVRDELPRWDKAGGRPLAGLTRRRKAEVELFLSARLPVQQQPFGNPLQVPWYSQLDSADRAQARRMCFSSSNAMLLQYLKPGTLTGPNGDDQFLKRVQQYGDTTNPDAQIRALSSYGIRARFIKTCTFQQLEQQINRGVPVPCGFLHRGPVSKPSGGGHWLIVVGYTSTHLVVHDPFGEADLVTGATVGGVARFMQYSRKNFSPRWMVEGNGTGWAILADR
jgi:GH24 family phage-related lysozyme (muramidase)